MATTSSTDARTVAAFEELVREGEAIVNAAQNSRNGIAGESMTRLAAWVTSVEQLLTSVFAASNPYWRNLQQVIEEENKRGHELGFYNAYSGWHTHLSKALGFLKAAANDFQKGRTRRIRELVRAEVFSDFLEMGEHLLVQGYKDAAAVIVGGVLEDAIRRFAEQKGVPLLRDDGKPKSLEPLNQDLGKMEAYSMLVQKRVTSWIELRNRAAHAEYDKYTAADVQAMLEFVRTFTGSLG